MAETTKRCINQKAVSKRNLPGSRARREESRGGAGKHKRTWQYITLLLYIRHNEREKNYTIHYYSDNVQQDIYSLPPTLKAKYISYSRRMELYGTNLGEPHTKAMGNGLFELRLKGAEGIGRIFYCAVVGKSIFMLHSFIKKTQKNPQKELEIAISRMKEIKNGK
ncbi:MAG: type II toxin-antitoxin system RelE/ParE family toxin [Oxalobacter formigenes]|nr:type II toxin-antitoxin system RelE/ParE family toxin [Oxalobacter formigenes]